MKNEKMYITSILNNSETNSVAILKNILEDVFLCKQKSIQAGWCGIDQR